MTALEHRIETLSLVVLLLVLVELVELVAGLF